jgi:hypothetical protein
MSKADPSVKILLGLIALFLGILALRPLMQVSTNADAQTTANPTVTGDGAISLGPSVIDVASVLNETGKAVRGIYIMDSARCFVVQYDDHLRVYGIHDVKVPQGTSFQSKPTGPALILGR